MHILITGGAGFIGSHFAEYHLKKGDSVHVVDNLITGSLQNIQPFFDYPQFRFDKADIVTWDSLTNAVESADRIYHLAAIVGVFHVIEEPLNVLVTNINGTEQLLKTVLLAGVKPHIFIASSSSVYGHSQKAILSETDELKIHSVKHPLTSYAISKITNEVMSLAYHRMYHIPITILRLFNTIGPRQASAYGMVIPRFINQSAKNLPLTVFGDGTQTRSFCDIRDTVTFLNLLAENTASIGEIINVGNDREISIIQLANLIKQILHSDSEIIHIPYEEAYGEKIEDIMRRKPDISKLSKLTNYTPEWTLENTVEDLTKQKSHIEFI